MLALFVFQRYSELLTWTTGSLMCVRDHSHACVYTRGLGTPTASQHNIFDSEKLSPIFLVLLTQTGIEPRVFGSQVRRSTEPPRHEVPFVCTITRPCLAQNLPHTCVDPVNEELLPDDGVRRLVAAWDFLDSSCVSSSKQCISSYV